MQALHHPDAPAAVGPYAQAIVAGGFAFCSGRTPLVPATMRIEALIIVGDQTQQVPANLVTVPSAQGSGLADVVQTSVFLKNIADFTRMNAEAFGAHRPAHTTVEVPRLPLESLVKIECLAVLPADAC